MYGNKYHYTHITLLMLLFLAFNIFEVTIEPFNFWFFGSFLICHSCFSFLAEKSIIYLVHNDPVIKRLKLSLYETIKNNYQNFNQLQQLITNQRNLLICEYICNILYEQKHPAQYYSTDTIQRFFETKNISKIIQNSSLSKKLKREGRYYIGLYNNNTDDLIDIKIDYENQSLLKNNTNISNMISVIGSIIFGLLSLWPLAYLGDLIQSRIINIVIVILVGIVYIIERYKEQKEEYRKYYSDIITEIQIANQTIDKTYSEE